MELIYSNSDDALNSHVEISPGEGYTKELGELNYTIGAGTNCGFWKHLYNSKFYYQCGYYEQDDEGRIFWCVYDQRTDHHKNYKGVHVHKTKKPLTNGPLDMHLRPTTTHLKSRYDIYSKMAHFTATANLSLKNGCSDDLFQIIYSSLNYYRNHYHQYAKAPIEKIVPKIGPQKIREIMINTADQMLEKSISQLCYSKYISICLDGGQTGSRHFIDFVAWNKKSSFSIFIKDTENLNSKGYADLALECLNHEKILKIQSKVVCFIGDGLRAQVAGLNPMSSESFQKRRGIGNLSKILFSPCFNHRLQNAFKKTYREMKYFRDVVNKVNKLAIYLRKPSQIKVLKKICPEPITTRWQYIFNICIFLQQNIECINKIINSEESNMFNIDFDIRIFTQIIHPLRSATLIFSKNSCCLGDVYPIVIEIIKQYENLKIEINDEKYVTIIDKIIKNIKYYTTTSPEQSFILLAYVLTPQGRSAMYKLENGVLPENEEKYVSFTEVKLPDLLTNLNEENVKENEEICVDALLDIINEEQAQQIDDIDFFKKTDDDAELEQKSDKGSTYEICKIAISKLISFLKISILEQQNLFQRLHEWINFAHDKIPFHEIIENNDKTMAIWEEILKTQTESYQKWKTLADIAIRLNSIAATETNCERTISLQGFIAKNRAQNSKPDLLNARLVHMQNK